MENSEPGGALTTARHRPSQDRSAGPGCDGLDGYEDPDGHEECDLVTVPARQGLEAVDILRRGAGAEAVGPVLHDGGCDTLGFLVPPGTADGWDLPGSACTQTFGRDVALARDPDPVPAPPVAGTGWLVPPGDTDPVTDPAVLRAALGEAARMIEAADNCR
ncbi:hypothetical protein [Streptomyces sp. NPDC127108]|uniref:hypothetical protein n=1 Tax=Streptomyces sp. NPDC127108 TaxID=3345361 RepID=UPI003628EBC1